MLVAFLITLSGYDAYLSTVAWRLVTFHNVIDPRIPIGQCLSQLSAFIVYEC